MSDRNHVHALVRDITRDLTVLHDRWWHELMGEAWTGAGEVTYVTGGGTSDPTGEVAVTDRRSDAAAIVDTLEHVARALSKRLETLRTRQVERPCVTSGCEGGATHGRYCERCDRWLRANRHTGMTPDQVVRTETDERGEPTGRTVSLVDDWNASRVRYCECSDRCCPTDADGYTTCHDPLKPGDGRISGRCRTRQTRARQRAEAMGNAS